MKKIVFLYVLVNFLLSAPVDVNRASEVVRYFYNSRLGEFSASNS